MRLEDITPVILTFNEEPNIGRTLDRLSWAKHIVVVDSFSDDDTAAIVARCPKATLFRRRFDSHAKQWNFAIRETGITTDWVLALDADYQVPDELTREIEALTVEPDVGGFRARFVYCVCGKTLRGTAYPPVTILFHVKGATYVQDGHTQRVHIEGRVGTLVNPILLDDRKSLSSWPVAQSRYTRLEADKLLNTSFTDLSAADRLWRMIVVAPTVMFFFTVCSSRVTCSTAGLAFFMRCSEPWPS